MTRAPELTSEQVFVERVKTARRSGAVLKARLLTLRSDMPDAVVLAFEGDDDKIVYGQWIRRIRPGLRYEQFPCGGKKEARDLKNILNRDLGRLKEKIFFVVDRDYNDLQGFEDSTNVFVTDTYSLENYLVDTVVLEELLRDVFPCHAKPDVRKRIIEIFDRDYTDFLKVTADINRRLFIARRLNIELTKPLPTSMKHIAVVRIGNVTAVAIQPDEVIVYEREPTEKEMADLSPVFSELDPKSRYRGKFALKFFREWLNKLADEYAQGEAGALGRTMPEGSIRRAELVLSTFASKSRLPSTLPDFINTIH